MTSGNFIVTIFVNNFMRFFELIFLFVVNHEINHVYDNNKCSFDLDERTLEKIILHPPSFSHFSLSRKKKI